MTEKIPGFDQTTDKFQFWAFYEYEGQRHGQAIIDLVQQNFVFPCWTHPYMAPMGQELGYNYLNMLDVRTLKSFKTSKEKHLGLVLEDKSELVEMRQIYENQYDQESFTQLSNYRREAKQLDKKWTSFQKFIGQQLQFIKEQPTSLKVFLFQRIYKRKEGVKSIDIVKDQYFLIRLERKSIKQSEKICLYEEKNWVYLVNKHDYSFSKEHKKELLFSIKFIIQEPLSADVKARYSEFPENAAAQLLKLKVNVTDSQNFFVKDLGDTYVRSKRSEQDEGQYDTVSSLEREHYFWIDPLISRNRIFIPYQEGKFQRNKIHLGKHFHLAFQGGGAKGLAYVGAYRSIRKQKAYIALKQMPQKMQVPIKSIIGSSAGGIIALAVSTGIPDYQLQKICYKMNGIPINDKFFEGDKNNKAYDDYGNQITIDYVKESIYEVLQQYGIIQKDVLKKIINNITNKKEFVEMQDLCLQWLSVNSPAFGQILTQDNQKETINKLSRKKINWQGLLLHGALMKGDAIHQIATQCLAKYLLKQTAFYRRRSSSLEESQKLPFATRLRQCINPFGSPQQRTVIEQIIEKYYQASYQLLKIDLVTFFTPSQSKLLQSSKKALQVKFLIFLVNRFLNLTDNFAKIKGKTLGGLILKNGGQPIQMKLLPLKDNANDLVTYFSRNAETELKNKIMNAKDLTYGELSGILNGCSLVDPQDYISDEKLLNQLINAILQSVKPQGQEKTKQLTILQYMQSIFGQQLKQIKIKNVLSNLLNTDKWTNVPFLEKMYELVNIANGPKDMDDLFFAFEAAQSVSEVYTLITNKPQDAKLLKNSEAQRVCQNYKRQFETLKKAVSKITMLQYYRLTQVELSCTSVDLDNKILRFFNHKTTPDLPVCRAVQMTGSFPCGFKAQKWKKEWGYYYVHDSNHKVQVDIQGHEFTDGGLLANFPIKYMDNQEIRKRYFSNKSIEGLTILLGFGLDYLDPSRYQPSEKQLKVLAESRRKSLILMAQIKKKLSSIKNGIGWEIFSDTKGERKNVQWLDIEHHLLNEIPLLRFGLKLLEAYPNADRNLNLQAFDNKILNQELQPVWTPNINDEAYEKAEERAFLKEFFDDYRVHISKKIDHVLIINDSIKSQQKTTEILIKEINSQLNRRQKKLKIKIETIKKQFLDMATNYGPDMLQPQCIRKLKVQKQEPSTTPRQRGLSLKIIHIFYLHLQMTQNKEVTKNYSRLYAFMKYLANIQKYNQKQIITTTGTSQNVIRPMNITCFQNLFDQGQFDKIAQQLSFLDFGSTHYKDFAEKLKQREIQESEDQYNVRKQHSYKSFLDKQKQKNVHQLQKIFQHDPMFNEQAFNVSMNMRRTTQLIYLLVKGRQNVGNNIWKLKDATTLKSLITWIKSFNYTELLQDHPQESKGKEFQKLTFIQIVEFLKHQKQQLKSEKSKHFSISKDFKDFLQLQETQQYENIYVKYLRDTLVPPNSELVDIKTKQEVWNQRNALTTFYFRLRQEYKFIVDNKCVDKLKIILKNTILAQGNHQNLSALSKLLYYTFCNKLPSKDDETALTKIKQFIQFIFDDPKLVLNTGENMTLAKQQTLKRKKDKAINCVYKQIKSFFQPQEHQKAIQKFKKENLDILHTTAHKIQSVEDFTYYIQTTVESTLQQKVKIAEQFVSLQKCLHRLLKPQEGEEHKKCISKVMDNSLKLIFLDTIRWYLDDKLMSQKSEKNTKCLQLNKSYYNDMRFLLNCLKEIIYMIREVIYGQPATIIRDEQYIYSYKRQLLLKKTLLVYSSIFDSFIQRYQLLSEVSLNDINQATLGNAFMINYKDIRILSNEIFQIVKRDYLFIKQKQALQQKYKKEAPQKEHEVFIRTQIQERISVIYHLFQKLFNHKFSIPNLKIDLQLSFQRTQTTFRNQVIDILLKQVYPKVDSFEKKLVERKDARLDNTVQTWLQDHKKRKQEEQKIECQKIKQQVIADIANFDSGVHLVLQGVEHSNVYFGALYANISSILQDYKINQIERIKHSSYQDLMNCLQRHHFNTSPQLSSENSLISFANIKMITCSNFHSIFGFLLSMGYSPEFVKRQMYQLQHTTNIMQDKEVIQSYFESMTWADNTPSTFSRHLSHLQKAIESDHSSFFGRLEQLIPHQYGNTLLASSYKDTKELYEHQRDYIMKVHMKILEATSQSVTDINNNFQVNRTPLELAKKFGFQYACQLKGRHKYNKKVEESLEEFKKLALKLIDTWGTLLYGIICNNFIHNNNYEITPQNASIVAKGVMVNRLLTTYKLKLYIFQKLKQSRLSPSITLANFYEQSKRKLLLNFTVIDVERQRLTIFNKNTMPNMPLWAAIVATSSLPFLHNFFEGNKEWQATNPEQFLSFFLYDFFKMGKQQQESQNTQYTSGNYISSLPLELLTNNTIRSKLIDTQKDKDLLDLKYFAICFNPSQKNLKKINVVVEKKYFNISWKQGLKHIWDSFFGSSDQADCGNKVHKNNRYIISYNPLQYISTWLYTSTLFKALQTLVSSNDNLILQWYYSKLIRLPIKVGTLQFNEIVNEKYLQQYGVNVLSEKAADSIEKSYYVTQTFIYDITRRLKEQAYDNYLTKLSQLSQQTQTNDPKIQKQIIQQVLSPRRPPPQNISNILKQIIKQHCQVKTNKFKVCLRVSIFDKIDSDTGFKRKYLKMYFLNHSKWNINMYSNYKIQYKLYRFESKSNNVRNFTPADESQIVWLVENNQKISLKFFYLLKSIQQDQLTYQRKYEIRQTEFVVDCTQIVQQLPMTDSYDYEFIYGWQQHFEEHIKPKLIPNQFISCQPIRRNKELLTQDKQNPNLNIKLVQNPGEHEQVEQYNQLIKKSTDLPEKKQ